MPKKKQPHNAFFFFMLDYKARCERNGERFPGGLKDVQEDAGAEWKVMNAAQRKPYEDQAKIAKQEIKNDNTKKVTNMHNSFDWIDKQKMKEEKEKNDRESWVTGTLAALTRRGVADHKFYTIHVNYFCISEGDIFHPAELAIAKFSLRHGVEDVCHFIFNPGRTIPLGYRHEALTKSETTHRIPLEGNNGETDYREVINKIYEFLKKSQPQNGDEWPQLFTLPDNVMLNTNMTAVKNVLRMLSDSSDDDKFNIFQNYPVYNLEYLFYRLKIFTAVSDDSSFSSIALAQLELEKDVFNYTGHIACQFHYDEDCVEYCSKSYVQRWIYLICDHCCQELEIDLIPGQHVPLNADINYQRCREEELEKPAHQPAPFTWVDHSQEQKSTSSWAPREREPVPRPSARATATLGAAAAINSEEDYPAIAIGRGRGRRMGRGGPAPTQASWANVLKK